MSRRSKAKQSSQPDRSRETRQEVLLTIAAVLPSPFRFEDLVVAAWNARPALFGLKTYPYPNSNAVLPRVYGTHGLVARGCLRQVSIRLLEVTEAGRSKLAKMG